MLSRRVQVTARHKQLNFGIIYFLAANKSHRISTPDHKLSKVNLLRYPNPRVMRILVVLLFAVFTGCNGNLLYADPPKPQLEVLTDAVLDLLENQKDGAPLRESVNWEAARERFEGIYEDFKQRLAPITNSEETQALGKVLRTNMEQAVRNMQPVLEDMTRDIGRKLQQMRDDFVPYVEDLREKLLKKASPQAETRI